MDFDINILMIKNLIYIYTNFMRNSRVFLSFKFKN